MRGNKMTILKDKQGAVLAVGDKVAFVGYANANSLTIGTIKKINKTNAEVAYYGLWSTKQVRDKIYPLGMVKVGV
jgi:hypothetical protein